MSSVNVFLVRIWGGVLVLIVLKWFERDLFLNVKEEEYLFRWDDRGFNSGKWD